MEYHRYCPKCGHPNSPDNKFCVNCGARLDPYRQGNSTISPSSSLHSTYGSYQKRRDDSQENGHQDTAALVLGILSICSANIILGIVAIVLGSKRASINSRARAGRICGIIGLVLSLIAFCLYIVYLVFWSSGFQEIREEIRESFASLTSFFPLRNRL